MRKRGEGDLSPIGAIMRQAGMAPPSAQKLRLIDAAATIAAGEDDREIAYHHTVFCQTALPYRHVEDRIWERTNGFLSLSIEAGRAMHPETQKWVELPLPYGPKARLIQIHLDTQAKLLDKPMIELEGSMTVHQAASGQVPERCRAAKIQRPDRRDSRGSLPAVDPTAQGDPGSCE